jgi:hypothetical protein
VLLQITDSFVTLSGISCSFEYAAVVYRPCDIDHLQSVIKKEAIKKSQQLAVAGQAGTFDLWKSPMPRQD